MMSRGATYRKTSDSPLTIPAGALSYLVYAPLLVKNRDEKTGAVTMLEDALR